MTRDPDRSSPLCLVALGLASLLVLSVTPRQAWATAASDLCLGDPCVIVGNPAIDDGSVLDFGGATVQLVGTMNLTAPSAAAGTVTILAGDFTIESSGSIQAHGGGQAAGGHVTISTTGDIQLLAASTAIKVNGNPGGSIVLAAGGSVNGAAGLNLRGQGNGSTGGELVVLAEVDITLSGLLEGDGHSSGAGGTFTFLSDGSASIASTIDLAGSSAVGGTAVMEACDLTVTGSVSAPGTTAAIDVLGVDSLTMSGVYSADAASNIQVGWGPLADPPDLAGASFIPGSVQALQPGESCGATGDDDDDDDSASGDDDDDDATAGDDDDDATSGDDDDSASGDDDDSASGDDDDATSGDDDDDDATAGDDDDDSASGDDDDATAGDDDDDATSGDDDDATSGDDDDSAGDDDDDDSASDDDDSASGDDDDSASGDDDDSASGDDDDVTGTIGDDDDATGTTEDDAPLFVGGAGAGCDCESTLAPSPVPPSWALVALLIGLVTRRRPTGSNAG